MKIIKLTAIVFLASIIIIFFLNMLSSKNWIENQNYNSEASHIDDIKKPLNVILLTYFRSGSTLTGELLSTINCSYIFEPLYYICQLNDNSCRNSDFRAKYMEKVINCDGDVLFDFVQKMWVPIVRKMNSITNIIDFFKFSPQQLSDLCHQNQFHVYKTARLRVADVLKLLKERNSPNTQIVHLVRDPRARYNSERTCILCEPTTFSIQKVCEEMEVDLRNSYFLPKHRYTRLRYEDLVEDPIGQMNTIFKRVYDQEIANATVNYIKSHMGEAKSSVKYDRNFKLFYGTNRSLGVDVNRWKTELRSQEIKLIQDKCKYVLDELKYN